MSALTMLKKRLRPGGVYRRKDLQRWSNAVDRHIQQLLKEGRLEKVSGGLYMALRKTRFGKAPATSEALVRAFLKDDRFLLVPPNSYNGLGVGTTQLHSVTIVYNHKRHGRLRLDGRMFDFRRRMTFPRQVSEEFLLVDLLHNLERLPEEHKAVRERALARARNMDCRRLSKAVHDYDSARVRKLLDIVLDSNSSRRAA